MPLDRDGEAPAKLAGSAEIARITELHDRPQLVEPVLHRGAGHGHSALGRQLPDRSRLLGRRILDELSLVQHHPPPANPHQRVVVAWDQSVGGDHHVIGGRKLNEAPPQRSLRSVVNVA